MGEGCTFIRLLADEDKGAALAESVGALRGGEEASGVFSVDPEKFAMVPGSPFAYWVSDRIRRLFVDLPPFGGERRTIKQGLATADDPRFVRAWWEVDPARVVTGTEETTPEEFKLQTCAGKKWAPFAKGGEYSPYYADVHLVVNWGNSGEEIKNRINPDSGRPYSNVWMLRDTEVNHFFRPGLTWPLRTNGLSFRGLPKGCIFGHKGPAIFYSKDDTKYLTALNAITQSGIFDYLVKSLVARVTLAQSYEVGLIQSIPIPPVSELQIDSLNTLVISTINKIGMFQRIDEINHLFTHPMLPDDSIDSITGVSQNSEEIERSVENEIEVSQHEIETIVIDLYGIRDGDDEETEISRTDQRSLLNIPPTDPPSLTAALLSYAVGAILGRWDIRYATGEKQPPALLDPFAPLPACSPGMLQGEDGLPLDPHDIPPGYPLTVDPDGILVDDEGHPDDIIARIRDVLSLIWPDRADAIEKEACEILGVKTLRDYFRKPGKGGFWDDHVKRYSKSRRKAPIYWLLQSAKKNYAIWIYYPRMDGDTLYKALRYAKDKLAMEGRRLDDLQKEREQSGTGGAAVKRLEKEIEGKEALVSELNNFVEKFERAANLDLIPEHDDGVVLTIAPLRELVPWNEPGKYWDELIEGKYEWSSIGKQLAEKELVTRS